MFGIEKQKTFYTKLYRDYKSLMFSQAFRYTKDRATAEDTVQDVMEKLLGKYDTLTRLNCYTLASYIVYTVRSVALNRLKREGLATKYADTFREYSVSPSAESVMLSALPFEELPEIWALLPIEDQLLLERKYFLELNTRELSALYHCSPACIRERLSRARARAKVLMQKSRE